MAAPLPNQVGSCAETFIKEIHFRLAAPEANGGYVGVPISGSAIPFTNGGYQVLYDRVHAIHRSQPRINQESVLPLSQIAPVSAIATREGVFMKLLICELVNAGSYLTASTVVAALKIV